MPTRQPDASLERARLRYSILTWAAAHVPHTLAGYRAFEALCAAALDTAELANAEHGPHAINAAGVHMRRLSR